MSLGWEKRASGWERRASGFGYWDGCLGALVFDLSPSGASMHKTCGSGVPRSFPRSEVRLSEARGPRSEVRLSEARLSHRPSDERDSTQQRRPSYHETRYFRCSGFPEQTGCGGQGGARGGHVVDETDGAVYQTLAPLERE